MWSAAILNKKASLDQFSCSYLQENKELGTGYTEFSVKRTHSQIRNPSWVSFPVLIYRKIRNWGVVILKLVSNAPILK